MKSAFKISLGLIAMACMTDQSLASSGQSWSGGALTIHNAYISSVYVGPYAVYVNTVSELNDGISKFESVPGTNAPSPETVDGGNCIQVLNGNPYRFTISLDTGLNAIQPTIDLLNFSQQQHLPLTLTLLQWVGEESTSGKSVLTDCAYAYAITNNPTPSTTTQGLPVLMSVSTE